MKIVLAWAGPSRWYNPSNYFYHPGQSIKYFYPWVCGRECTRVWAEVAIVSRVERGSGEVKVYLGLVEGGHYWSLVWRSTETFVSGWWDYCPGICHSPPECPPEQTWPWGEAVSRIERIEKSLGLVLGWLMTWLVTHPHHRVSIILATTQQPSPWQDPRNCPRPGDCTVISCCRWLPSGRRLPLSSPGEIHRKQETLLPAPSYLEILYLQNIYHSWI